MAGEIASLFVKLGLDARDFTAGINDANKTTQGFAKGASSVGALAKGGFLAMGAGLAVVTKGAAEAERAQGNFMAATGATRDEAKAFVSSMDGLAGSAGAVGLSFQQIADTGTMVQQQFGTTGQATTDLTETVLEFAKATHQDATQAAAGLDDTLSAYGLSAKDAAGFTDQLVASAQKYGTGVGPDQIDVLRKMAPALQAVGGDLQDGIGFLNLYEQAGGDASTATRGLTTAITKLPAGENLDQFVAHLAALKSAGIDPTSEAIKVFGSRAGVGLAKAIQPGMTSMSDLTVAADVATGSVTDTADAMMTTGDRIKGMADKVIAGAREIGQKFGPAITGAASLASLTAPFVKGFAKMGAPAAKAFAKPFTSALSSAIGAISGAGSKLGAKLAAPITNALTGAFLKLTGNPKIGGAMDKLGGFMGGRLGGGMATAFKAAGILALIAVAIQEWGDLQKQIDANKKAAAGIDKATGDYLAGMPSPQDVQAKIDALKQVPQSLTGVQSVLYNLGSLGEGNVIGSAFDALFGANPAQVADDKIKQMEDYLKTTGTQNVAAGVDSVAGAVADGAPKLVSSFDDMVQAWEDGSAALIDQGQTLAGYDPQIGQWMTGQDFLDASPDVQDAVQTWIDAQNKAIDKGAADDAKALADMKSKITDGLSAIQDAFTLGDTTKKKNISGADRLKSMAKDIDAITKNLHDSIAANDPVNTAYWESALIDATNKYNTAKGSINVDSAQIAADVATATQSAGADLTGLGNKATDAAGTVNDAAANVNMNPAANNIANATSEIHDSFMHIGTYASNVPGAISQADKGTSAAAKHLAALISDPLNALNPYQWGTHLGDDLVAGMRVGNKTISAAAVHWAHLLSDPLHFSRPPDKGPLHTVPEWGVHMIDQWIGPMLKHGMRKVPAAARQLAEYLKSLDGHNGIGDPAIAAPTSYKRHDHRRHNHNHVSNPDPVAQDDTSGSGVTVHVTVNGNIYGTGGTKQLAADLEKYIRRSKRGGARLVGAF